MRQRDLSQRQLLAQVRRGDPTNYITEKERRGQLQVIEGDVQSASAGERARSLRGASVRRVPVGAGRSDRA
jgi:hypothetical protein